MLLLLLLTVRIRLIALLEALCAEIFNKDLEPNFLKGEFLFKNKNSPLGSNKNSPLGQISPLGRKGDPLS